MCSYEQGFGPARRRPFCLPVRPRCCGGRASYRPRAQEFFMAGSCGSCSLGRTLDIASTATAKTSAQARATAAETRKRSRSFLC